ncbi:MAG: hypothetical protein KC422_01500 [Trueperaceae bacterium]|nr:hypothetical protein [Trueperaceae bacterium]
MVLVVNPRNKTVNVHRRNQDIQILAEGNSLAPQELPGWQLLISDIFE